MRATGRTITSNTQVQCRFKNSFELERQKQLSAPILIKLRATIALLYKTLENSLAYGLIVEQDEIPRLHESDGTGVMSRRQNPNKDIMRYRTRFELPPDVTPQCDGFVNRCPLLIAKILRHLLTPQ